MGLSIFDEVVPISAQFNAGPGEGTSDFTMFGPFSPQARADAIIAASSDTIDHVFNFSLVVAGSVMQIASLTIPAGAGFGLVPAVDLIAALPTSLQGGVYFTQTNQIAGRFDVVISGGKIVYFTLQGAYV